MTRANERKNDDDKPKKSELLPAGDKANDIVEVLVAMFRARHNSEDAAKGGDSSEHANQRRDSGEKR